MLSKGPKIIATSFHLVSALPAGNGRATVRFTVAAHGNFGGTSVPVLRLGTGSQQWFVATEQAGHWYVDLGSSTDFADGYACN
jgi:hypothetical protein